MPRGNPKGNPNPSPATRFKPGTVANPKGKTSEQRQAEIKNAWLATELRTRFLERLRARMMTDAQIDAALDKLNLNSFLKDSEDRGLGAPKAQVDVTTNGKDMPGAIDLSMLSSETLAELIAARDAAKPD